jgi:hypothetical protein
LSPSTEEEDKMGTVRLKNIILLAATLALTLNFLGSKAQTVPYWYRVSRLEDAILKTRWEVRGTHFGSPFSYVFEADFNVLFFLEQPVDKSYGGGIRAEVIEFSAVGTVVKPSGQVEPTKPISEIWDVKTFPVTSAKIRETDESDPHDNYFVKGWMGFREESEVVIFYFDLPGFEPSIPSAFRGEDHDIYYYYLNERHNIRISKAKLARREDFTETFVFEDVLSEGSSSRAEVKVTLTFEFLGCPVEIASISGDVEIRDGSNRRMTDSVVEELQIRKPEFKTATGDDGEITYRCPDESIIRVYPRSEVDIKTICKKKKRIETRVFLFLGKLWIKITEIFGVDREFKIGTQGTVAGPRGTTFSVEARRRKGKVVTVYKVEEGSIWVRDKKTGETVVLGAGQTYSHIQD